MPESLEYFLEAFSELSSSRSTGVVAGSIPFEAIDRYADRYEVGEFDEFRRLIRAMDEAYLDYVGRRSKGKEGGSGERNRPQGTTRRTAGRSR